MKFGAIIISVVIAILMFFFLNVKLLKKSVYATICQTMAASELRSKSFKNVSKTVYQVRSHQILSDHYFRSYSDFKVFKALNCKK